jgi:hypothetical protein
MHKFVIAYLSFALFACAQTVVVVPSKPSLPVPRMEKGLADGRTYKNSSIGVELRVAEGLTFGTPELKGTPGIAPLLVTVTALRNETLFSPRYVTVFYADALAYYPEGQRSTDAYVRKVVKGNQLTGYEATQETFNVKFGGVSFARRDFRGPFYEAVLVKSCDAQALVFIFASSDKDTVDKLIGETDLKLDSESSGCHSSDTVSK